MIKYINALEVVGPCVYVLARPDTVKIGFSTANLQERIQAIQIGSDRKLQLLFVFPEEEFGDVVQAEKLLHQLFKEYRCESGEWFHRSPFVLAVLDAIAAEGRFLDYDEARKRFAAKRKNKYGRSEPTADYRRWYSPPVISRMLRVEATTVIGWIKSGKLQAFDSTLGIKKKPRYKVSPESLEAFLGLYTPVPAPKLTRERKRQAIPDRHGLLD